MNTLFHNVLHNFIVPGNTSKPLYNDMGILTIQKSSIKKYTDNRKRGKRDSSIHNTTVRPLTAIRVNSIQMCPTLSFTHFCSF